MNDIQNSIKMLSNKITDYTKREANETKIAARILSKIITNNFKITKKKVTDEEIIFLKDHSKDIMKIIPIIIMFPTPIPYIEILLILKGFGIDILLPSGEALKIPESEK